MPQKISTEQRRARLAVRHHLAAPAATVAEAVAGIVALHATDPATVHLSASARLASPSVSLVEQALYADRSLLRLLGMRRTVFVTDLETAALVQAGCTADILVKQRKLLEQHLGRQGHPENVPEPAKWLASVEASVEEALRARGSATAQQLSEDEPRLRQQLRMAPGKPYEAIGNVTSRVLFLLAAGGRMARGRPRGSWTSTQYVWHPLDEWVPGGLRPWEPEAARVELARRWLRAYGPAPVSDLRWWTGWTAGQTKKALAGLPVAEADLEGVSAVALADDLDPVPVPDPWVAFLPALDPTPMGWQDRDWFLGPHRPALFDRSGNIGPTIWSDGRVVGGWAQRPSGDIAWRLLEDVGGEVTKAVEVEAERCAEWFGEVRAVPRFRTPLERELSA
ncbi:winged helix DNA-binding domain-containing protein [Amycolatopsis sp. SID8362]|uniref:winged helix DNA-binding domain-containing protein n=1 Tax=Amycolatopsis sp. SID8362 TaxID=2690346 RepID=UPI001372024B|nr:winged helix DNA-binding domain-containing protein [Amycolatopsis sp. SID8362]NBH03012.1 winged helix DNA-binding domain-containing protein [Amycolatopsis sp. SID8362]NED39713.1 winged helix DNA-binding domain-containing protein [Amycolatopsis sp. SID8362]